RVERGDSITFELKVTAQHAVNHKMLGLLTPHGLLETESAEDLIDRLLAGQNASRVTGRVWRDVEQQTVGGGVRVLDCAQDSVVAWCGGDLHGGSESLWAARVICAQAQVAVVGRVPTGKVDPGAALTWRERLSGGRLRCLAAAVDLDGCERPGLAIDAVLGLEADGAVRGWRVRQPDKRPPAGRPAD